MSYGTLLGDIYHGFFQPDEARYVIPRVIFMVVVGISGMFLGGWIQRNFLRDYLQLTLFGFDDKKNLDRPPECADDGGFFMSLLTTALLWLFGLRVVYNGILEGIGGDGKTQLRT